jgi:hypothetical protein
MKATIERLREWNRTIRASGLSDLLEEAASKLEEMEQLREQDAHQMSALIAGYQRIQRDCIDGTESRAGTDGWKTVSDTSEPGDQESKSPERECLTDEEWEAVWLAIGMFAEGPEHIKRHEEMADALRGLLERLGGAK